MIRRPPRSTRTDTLFPYTTLFRSATGHAVLLIVRRSHRDGNGASVLGHLDPRVKVETVPDRLFTGRAIAKALAAFAPDVVHCHLRRATRIVARTQPPAALVATLHIDFNSPVYGAMDAIGRAPVCTPVTNANNVC